MIKFLYLLPPFFLSLLLSYSVTLIGKFRFSLFAEGDLYEPQKIHTEFVPRIGGIAIFISLLISFLIVGNYSLGIPLLLCSSAVFIAGTAEDITKKVSIKKRLFCAFLSSALACTFLNVSISKIDILFLDYLFKFYVIAQIFTIFAIVGLINSYNIIDGLNGLSSMLAIISLLFISLLSFLVNDYIILNTAIIVCFSIFGFFLINYPHGKIFLGDGGAYLCGFLVATLSCLLVERNQQISPWFAVLINSYPIIETVFSIYRRSIHQKSSPGKADRLHLHSLIYRRVFSIKLTHSQKLKNAANSKSAIVIWAYSFVNATLALCYYNHTYYLIIILFLAFLFYLKTYRELVVLNSKFRKYLKV